MVRRPADSADNTALAPQICTEAAVAYGIGSGTLRDQSSVSSLRLSSDGSRTGNRSFFTGMGKYPFRCSISEPFRATKGFKAGLVLYLRVSGRQSMYVKGQLQAIYKPRTRSAFFAGARADLRNMSFLSPNPSSLMGLYGSLDAAEISDRSPFAMAEFLDIARTVVRGARLGVKSGQT